MDPGVTIVNPTEISVMYGYVTRRMTTEIPVMYGSEGVKRAVYSIQASITHQHCINVWAASGVLDQLLISDWQAFISSDSCTSLNHIFFAALAFFAAHPITTESAK